jgi:hypothetical protein
MENKLILFRDGRSILCSGEEPIVNQDWALDETFKPVNLWFYPEKLKGKIIAGIPSLPSISMHDEIRQGLFELYGWVDVNWLVDKKYPLKSAYHIQLNTAIKTGYIEGFNKNQELRGFSLKDMNIVRLWCSGDIYETCSTLDELCDRLKQEVIEINVELEMEDNFTENGEFGITDYGAKDKYYTIGKQPKITNNSVTITKLL